MQFTYMYIVCDKLSGIMICGSKMWPMKMEHSVKFDRNEMSRIKRTCGFTFRERTHSAVRIVGIGTSQFGN